MMMMMMNNNYFLLYSVRLTLQELTAAVTEVKRSYIELDKWLLLKYFKTIDVLKFSTI
jgi:hypothetical protein